MAYRRSTISGGVGWGAATPFSSTWRGLVPSHVGGAVTPSGNAVVVVVVGAELDVVLAVVVVRSEEVMVTKGSVVVGCDSVVPAETPEQAVMRTITNIDTWRRIV